jgi:hypothetical protein
MQLIKTMKNLYIDAICWFICIVSSFIGLALIETNTGHFLVGPLMIANVISISILAIMYGCDIEYEEPVEFERGSVYEPIFTEESNV